MSIRLFARSLYLVLLLSLGGLVGFNWLVDPYDIFGNDGWAGVNARKIDDNFRFSKAYVITRGGFDAVILGTSRGMRVNPEHPGFDGYRAYNASMPGSTIYENLRFLQHAQGAQPLRRAVIGLDYFSFAAARPWQAGFEEGRLTLDIHGRPVPFYKRLQDYGNALLSLDSFKASRSTWQGNRRLPSAAQGSEERQRRLGFGEANQATLRQLGGHHEASRIVERYCLRRDGLWLEIGQERYLNAEFGFLARSLRDFETLLRFAHRHSIDLRLYISPIHARLQLGTRYVGVEAAWDEWKRLLTAANEDIALELGRRPFDLWDFGNINRYTVEPIPRDTDSVMQWYEEASHFRTVLADRVLDVILGLPAGSDWVDEGFGTLLRRGNIEPYLVEQRAARDRWAAQHPDDVAYLIDMAGSERTLVAPHGALTEPAP